ncbi:RDD family protein [Streptomyces sp. NBC_01321]|uniref:RDD family protein n=1 Tax=Streptomyces sp. NBC_01321 TaxID=2903825 RepID=UPI002E10EC89|nr:RDD family protein [Streptomyces sp. NBC_01321]
MSAPTPAPGDESPHEGYYPDPSIPGYVRYWNGASWVPGTSRPAPQQGESMPGSPAGAAAEPPPSPQPSVAAPAPADAPVDETGPVYLDEEPHADNHREPATAWQADASRQTGFGGERDRRVSWGGTGQAGAQGDPDRQGDPGRQGDQREPSAPESGSVAESGRDPRTPADRTPAGRVPAVRAPADPVPADRAPALRTPADLTPVDPRRPASPEPTGGALPALRDGGGQIPENTVAIRVDRPGRAPASRSAEQAPADGTMAIRAIGPGTPAQTPPQVPRRTAAQPPAQSAAPAPAPAPNPASGPGGATPWAQQVHQLAQPDQMARPQPQTHQPQQPQAHQPQQSLQPRQPHPQFGAQGGQPDQPVVPWKPPVDDPFQQLVQAQAAARPAGLGKRFAARLVDTVVLGALVGAIGFPLLSHAMDHIDEKINAAKLSGETVTVWLVDSTTAGLFGAVLGAFLVLGVLLEALPTAKWGRTLGKKLCGLDVRDIESHETPSFAAALRRWLVYGLLGVLVVGVVNVLWCLIDRPWRQCWHDKAARTFVAG